MVENSILTVKGHLPSRSSPLLPLPSFPTFLLSSSSFFLLHRPSFPTCLPSSPSFLLHLSSFLTVLPSPPLFLPPPEGLAHDCEGREGWRGEEKLYRMKAQGVRTLRREVGREARGRRKEKLHMHTSTFLTFQHIPPRVSGQPWRQSWSKSRNYQTSRKIFRQNSNKSRSTLALPCSNAKTTWMQMNSHISTEQKNIKVGGREQYRILGGWCPVLGNTN